MTRDPARVAILAARLQRAYPQLSPFSAASLADDLQRIERAQRMHATRLCNGPRDVRQPWKRGEVFGYCKQVPLPGGRSPDCTAARGLTWVSDEVAEERADRKVANAKYAWALRLAELLGVVKGTGATTQAALAGMTIEREGDPRGCVLKLRLPGESEAVGV